MEFCNFIENPGKCRKSWKKSNIPSLRLTFLSFLHAVPGLETVTMQLTLYPLKWLRKGYCTLCIVEKVSEPTTAAVMLI